MTLKNEVLRSLLCGRPIIFSAPILMEKNRGAKQNIEMFHKLQFSFFYLHLQRLSKCSLSNKRQVENAKNASDRSRKRTGQSSSIGA
jgi:hypothetical protein